VFLLVGGGLALLLPAALNHFEVRYLVPSVPLILSGGVLAVLDLAGLPGRRRIQASQAAREPMRRDRPLPALKNRVLP